MKKLTAKKLLKKRVPYILVSGLLTASLLLPQGGNLLKKLDEVKDYYQLKQLFPATAVVKEIEDGDTFVLKNGLKVRFIGIDAPPGKSTEASKYLTNELINTKVYLEYDRYMDDPYGRLLAWVWVDCETTPKFLPPDYMHKSNNESMPGLTENPKGCSKGKLINAEMVIGGFAEPIFYKDRGNLKYEDLIKSIK